MTGVNVPRLPGQEGILLSSLRGCCASGEVKMNQNEIKRNVTRSVESRPQKYNITIIKKQQIIC